MSEHREEHVDLCAGYALGALGDAERRQLEAHLANGCSTCLAAIAEFSAATVVLAQSAPAAPPPADLRRRVLEAARASGARAPSPLATAETPPRVIELKPRPRVSGFAMGWAAAAAAFAIATILTVNQGEKLKAKLSETQRSLAAALRRLAEDRSLIDVLSAPQAKLAELQITPAGLKELRARATYDPRSESAVIVFDNFSAPSGRDYDLWALRGAGVVNLGVIKVDANGHAVLRLEHVGTADTLGGFAVTLEPAGGSPYPDKPTGPVVMAGKFSG